MKNHDRIINLMDSGKLLLQLDVIKEILDMLQNDEYPIFGSERTEEERNLMQLRDDMIQNNLDIIAYCYDNEIPLHLTPFRQIDDYINIINLYFFG